MAVSDAVVSGYRELEMLLGLDCRLRCLMYEERCGLCPHNGRWMMQNDLVLRLHKCPNENI